MAIQINIKPKQYHQTNSRSNFVPAYSNAIFQVSTTATVNNLFKFKFVFDLYINGIKKLRLKVEPNAENKGIIDVSRILQDYVEAEELAYNQTYSIHKLQQTGASDNSCQILEIRVGEEYATTAIGDVTIYNGYSTTAGDPAKTTTNFSFWNGVNQWSNGATDNEHFRSKFWTDYFLTGSTKKLLTNFPASDSIKQKIGSNDYHTIAFFYARFGQDQGAYSVAQSGGQYGEVVITFYNSAGATTGSAITYDVKDDISSQQTIEGTAIDGWNNFIYCGVGTQNILDNSGTIPADAASYSVKLQDNYGSVRSDTYYFEIDDCNGKGYNQIRLAWLNTLGSFDYFTFRQKNITEITNKKTYYGRQPGSWNAAIYKQSMHERGKSVINVEATEKILLNTHLINETEAEFLQDLFYSPAVYMFENSNVVPVCVLDTSYTKQTSANDKIIQYQVTIEKAHNIKVQNG